jgi:hypothetical protein
VLNIVRLEVKKIGTEEAERMTGEEEEITEWKMIAPGVKKMQEKIDVKNVAGMTI